MVEEKRYEERAIEGRRGDYSKGEEARTQKRNRVKGRGNEI